MSERRFVMHGVTRTQSKHVVCKYLQVSSAIGLACLIFPGAYASPVEIDSVSKNACFMVATGTVFGITDWGPLGRSLLINRCNNGKEDCVNARGAIRFVLRPEDERAGKTRVSHPVPDDLHCNGYKDPAGENAFDRLHSTFLPDLDNTKEQDAANEACHSVEATVLTGAPDHGQLASWVTQCSTKASKSQCESTRGFVIQNNDGKAPSGLTCH